MIRMMTKNKSFYIFIYIVMATYKIDRSLSSLTIFFFDEAHDAEQR